MQARLEKLHWVARKYRTELTNFAFLLSILVTVLFAVYFWAASDKPVTTQPVANVIDPRGAILRVYRDAKDAGADPRLVSRCRRVTRDELASGLLNERFSLDNLFAVNDKIMRDTGAPFVSPRQYGGPDVCLLTIDLGGRKLRLVNPNVRPFGHDRSSATERSLTFPYLGTRTVSRSARVFLDAWNFPGKGDVSDVHDLSGIESHIAQAASEVLEGRADFSSPTPRPIVSYFSNPIIH